MIKSYDELIDEYTKQYTKQYTKEYTKKLSFKVTVKEKTLPIMYCIFKMDKNPIDASFITASKICFTKQISKSVSNILSP